MSGLDFNAFLDTTQFDRGLARIQLDVRNSANQINRETEKVDDGFNGIGKTAQNVGMLIGAYFTGAELFNFAKQIVNVRGEFQQLEIAFTTMLGSQEKSNILMDDLIQLAAKTPFGMKEVSEGAKRLLAFQVPAEQVIDTLTRIGNVSAGLGVPMGQLIHVYGQVKAQGKLMTNDLYQFMNAGIPIISELGKVLGKTDSEIKDMVSDGKVGFAEIQQVIANMTNEGGIFYNLMENQSKSLTGQIANLEDAWESMLNEMGKQTEGIAGEVIGGLTYMVEHYEEVLKVLGVLVASYGAYRTALITTAVLQKSIAIAGNIQAFLQLASSIRSAKDAQLLFNMVTKANPYVLLATAVAGLVTYLVLFRKETDLATKMQKNLTDANVEAEKSIASEKAEVQRLLVVARDERISKENRLKAIKKLNEISPQYLGNLSLETINTEQAKNAIDAYTTALFKNAQAKAYQAKYDKLVADRIDVENKDSNDYRDGLGKAVDWLIGETKGFKNYQEVLDQVVKHESKVYKTREQQKERAMKLYKQLGLEKKHIELAQIDAQLMDLTNTMIKANSDIENVVTETATATPNTDETKKKAEAKKRELAEIYSSGSIADLQQRISLWNEALEKAKGDEVNVLAKDKYGDTYKTKQIVSIEKALEKREELQKLYDARLKEITKKSFDEELNALQKQISLKEKMLEFGYSNNEVDRLFPELKGKKYLEPLEEMRSKIQDIFAEGEGDEVTAENLTKINDAIDNLTLKKSSIEQLKESLDFKKLSSSTAEYVAHLEKLLAENPIGLSESSNERNQEIQSRLDAEKNATLQTYYDILKQHETFEEQKKAITEKYARIRQVAGEDLSESENTKLIKAEEQEIADLTKKIIESSTAYQMAFGNLEFISRRAIDIIIRKLEEYKQANAKYLKPDELLALQSQIDKLRNKLVRNPFKGLFDSFKGAVKAIKDSKQAQEEYNDAVAEFGDVSEQARKAEEKLLQAEQKRQAVMQSLSAKIDASVNYMQLGVDAVNAWGDAFGGLSDSAQNTMNDIMNFANGVQDTFKSFASGDVVGGVLNAVKTLGNAVGAIFNKDKKKEREIKRQQEALRGLQSAYNDLAYAVQNAFGSEKYSSRIGLINNLEEQKRKLQDMIRTEEAKKKTDRGKIEDWKDQIQGIEQSMNDLKNEMVKDVLQTDVTSFADSLVDAFVNAFERGEDAIGSMNKAFNDMIKNMLKNQMSLIMQDRLKPILDDLLRQAGFDANGQGTFRGLSAEAIAELRRRVQEEAESLQGFMDLYGDIFEGLNDDIQATSLSGAIAGITEDTADIIAGQLNAIRVHVATGLDLSRSILAVNTQIEINTRNLFDIRTYLQTLSENSDSARNSSGLRGLGLGGA